MGIGSQLRLYGDVQVDSRLVSKGTLFFALKGEKTDGHKFLHQVRKKGGVGAVVSKQYTGQSFGLELYFVDNVLDALQTTAKLSLETRKPFIIGITGSVGKTTTKEFTATLLEEKYCVAKSFANYNGQIGMPLSILNSDQNAELLVLEMAMTQAGHITRLVQIAPPDIAVLTKVDLVHSENFPDGIEGIKKAKAEIFSSKKTRVRIIGESLKDLIQGEKITFSSTSSTADYTLKERGEGFCVDEKGCRVANLIFPFTEKHFIEDALVAIAIARSCKVSWPKIFQKIAQLVPPKMRFEKIQYQGALMINDAYNAGPESIRAALESLPEPAKGRRTIAVFGEMTHLGSFAKEGHSKVGEFSVERVDEVLCIGNHCRIICELFKQAKKPAILYKNLPSLVKKLKEVILPGDVVLIKGSRDINLDKIFQHLDT